MPIYEYRCEDCGHELEAIQKMSDEPLTECPECGKPALKKMVSAAGFRLSGGGWYETDFKTGDKKKNLVSGGDGDKAAKKDSGDSKPAGESKSAASASGSSKSSSKGSESSSAA